LPSGAGASEGAGGRPAPTIDLRPNGEVVSMSRYISYGCGSSYGRAIDLSNSSGPQPRMVKCPPWPGTRVHYCRGERIAEDSRVYQPHEPVDMRCRGCRADALVHVAGGVLEFRVVHQPGCAAVAAMAGEQR